MMSTVPSVFNMPNNNSIGAKLFGNQDVALHDCRTRPRYSRNPPPRGRINHLQSNRKFSFAPRRSCLR